MLESDINYISKLALPVRWSIPTHVKSCMSIYNSVFVWLCDLFTVVFDIYVYHIPSITSISVIQQQPFILTVLMVVRTKLDSTCPWTKVKDILSWSNSSAGSQTHDLLHGCPMPYPAVCILHSAFIMCSFYTWDSALEGQQDLKIETAKRYPGFEDKNSIETAKIWKEK